MKIIHAAWEQRNLGVDCNEVLLEPEDTPALLEERAGDYETEYTVVKVPVGRMDLSLHLQSRGYVFMELLTVCHHEPALPTLTRIQQRLADSVSCEEMAESDRERLFEEIRGGMFEDDRVSLDPRFTAEQAAARYVGWINDEVERGTRLFKLVYKDETVGFFNLTDVGDGIHSAYLGGIYPGHQQHGFGLCMNYCEIREGIARGARRIVSTFSSNNRGACAIHFALGYSLGEQRYVLVKHHRRDG